jgi:hypothetical protein
MKLIVGLLCIGGLLSLGAPGADAAGKGVVCYPNDGGGAFCALTQQSCLASHGHTINFETCDLKRRHRKTPH